MFAAAASPFPLSTAATHIFSHPPPGNAAKYEKLRRRRRTAAADVSWLPRENTFPHPSPGNAAKYEKLRRAEERRRCCPLLLLLIADAALFAAVIYLLLLFQSPSYTVTEFAVRGMNLTSAAPISPEFDVTVSVANPNRKIGIYYLKESFVKVYCGGEILGLGVLPHFYQPGKNATVVRATAGSFAVLLDGAVKTELSNAQSSGRVPLVLTVEAPVKFKWFVKTGVFTAKAKCDVVLDELSDKAQIVSKHCDTDLNFQHR